MARIAQEEVNRQCNEYYSLCGNVETIVLTGDELEREIKRVDRLIHDKDRWWKY